MTTVEEEPEFTALNVPLPPNYGNSALAAMESRFNFKEDLPFMDMLDLVYEEEIKPYNQDFHLPRQNEIKITVPGNQKQWISSMELSMDIQPMLVDNVTPFTGNLGAVDNAGNAGNTDALRVIQRPLTPYLMFKDVNVEVNLNKVDYNSNNSQTYAFSQWLQMVLSINNEDQKRLRTSCDFDFPENAAENMDDDVPNNMNQVRASGTAWQRRRRLKMTKRQTVGDPNSAGRQHYTVGLNVPILKANNMPVVGTNINITLTKADQKCLFHHNQGINVNNAQMHIHDMKLKVQRTQLGAVYLEEVLKDVQKQGYFKFNVVQTKTYRYQLPHGNSTFDQQFSQSGSKPTMLFANFMDDSALSGNNVKSPFSMKNLKLETAKMTFDRDIFPHPAGYSWSDHITEMEKYDIYQGMCKDLWGMDFHKTEREKYWSYERYNYFCHTVVFDITRTKTAHLGNILKHPDEAGTVGIHMTFHEPIPVNTILMVTSLYTADIKLNAVNLSSDISTI